MFAAVSVGIGFGLQEIIANLVSGIILLLERPVRVGDIITVGTTGGTVEKISMRATMVTNWERKTIVIPNKDFITQSVTNWTHLDQITRRTLEIHVAYGSDVGNVLKSLNEVVIGHEHVLKDPAHRVWFSGFGDSSLEFTIWFFTLIDHGFDTITELNQRIYERFGDDGVTIPFPQRDLHVKTMPDAAAMAGLLDRDQPPS